MSDLQQSRSGRLNIAVIGTGIAGMSAAWLLSQRHDVTVYEQEKRLGGHSHTVDAPGIGGGPATPVDTGFIVYNDTNYPNLVALFEHLKVPTKASDMSFAVSVDGGKLEYGTSTMGELFAQWRNVARPRFWSMLRDLMRFYREAPGFSEDGDNIASLGDYLDRGKYGRSFQNDHLLPMAAAVWSTPAGRIRDYPAAAMIRFCDNHGLLKVNGRPQWRTVDGGSREYVSRLTAAYADRVKIGRGARYVTRMPNGGIAITDSAAQIAYYDHVVIAAHGDQALGMLSDPSADEGALLGAFKYTRNETILHTDTSLMPRRKAIWSSWNYLARSGDGANAPCVTYWMNRLQSIPENNPLFVTLNPIEPPRPDSIIRTELYEHPIFDEGAIRAQRRLWQLQGRRNTWFCGAYFGSGFHEDGLQAGLAVAEALGGVRRPWSVPDESGRIHLAPLAAA